MKRFWYWLVGVLGLVVGVLLARRRDPKTVANTNDRWAKKAEEVRADTKSETLADEARKPVEMPEALRQSGEWRIE